jgi:hypothetical protein
MSNITIEVEFLAGTDIRSAIGEAKIKASLWNVAYVKFSFNGIVCSISPRADVDNLVEKWHDGFGNEKFKYLIG